MRVDEDKEEEEVAEGEVKEDNTDGRRSKGSS
jgi:hypothetical protein